MNKPKTILRRNGALRKGDDKIKVDRLKSVVAPVGKNWNASSDKPIDGTRR